MKSYFEIKGPSADHASDSLWLILQYGDGLIGYILYAPEKYTIIKTQLWETGENVSDTTDILNVIKKELGEKVYPAKKFLVNYNPGYYALPRIVYHPEKLNYWIDLMAGTHPAEKIILSESKNNDIINAQSIDINDYTLLNDMYEEIIPFPFQEFAHYKKPQHDNTIRVSFLYKHIFVTLYINGEIHLNQAYPFETREDVLYLLLNITEHFSLDNETLSFIPEGFIESYSAIYKLLHQYFPNIQLPENRQYRYPESSPSVSPYILRHIDRIITCVS